MPHGDWDRLSGAGLAALHALFKTPGGRGTPFNIRPRARISTWRMLERYSLVRRNGKNVTPRWAPLSYEDEISITREGMEHIGVDPEGR